MKKYEICTTYGTGYRYDKITANSYTSVGNIIHFYANDNIVMTVSNYNLIYIKEL